MILIAWGLALIAGAYQVLAILACIRHLRVRVPAPVSPLPGISILKPVRGYHPGFEEALDSHALQDYPQFELLLGHHDPNDSALPAMRQAIQRHPGVEIRTIVSRGEARNAKVAVLRDMAREAKYPLLVVNDADIVVPAGYLRELAGFVSQTGAGLVTCLYKAEGDSWPARLEALGVDTDFAPSALVAPMTGVTEFGFGSTLAFWRKDLDAIGGFDAVASYLADDYQLGARIHRLARKNRIARAVVRTRLHAATWRAAWTHQVRWARTIRCSRLDGYLGLPVTFASVWAVAIWAAGWPRLGAGLMALRIAMALVAGWGVLKSRESLRLFWLIPLRDIWGAFVWVAGLFGSTVQWGGWSLILDRQGRIIEKFPAK